MADHIGGQGDSMENTVAAYVLGALEPREAEAVRMHLESCASCRELEARLRRTSTMLPLSVEEERPPARLRVRILTAAGAPATAPAPRRRALHLPLPRRHRLPFSPRTAAAAMLALAVLGLGAWNAYLTHQLQSARSAVASHQLTTNSPTLATASGRVVALRDQQVLLVEFKNMPPPEPGKVYELWLGTSSGTMVPVGVFRPDADGSKVVALNQDVSKYSVIALTVEQGPDGVQAPTQAPGMSGRV